MARKYWIKGALKHKGALREYVKKTFGESGFEPYTGNIKPELVNKIASGRCPVCEKKVCVCPSRLEEKRAVLARTLRRMRA